MNIEESFTDCWLAEERMIAHAVYMMLKRRFFIHFFHISSSFLFVCVCVCVGGGHSCVDIMTADNNFLQDPDCKNDPIFSVDIRFVSNNLLCLGFVIFYFPHLLHSKHPNSGNTW